jgi:hypothetical protein
MAASEIAVSTTPPLPGTVLVQQINDAFQAVATQFSGAVDPAAYADAYMLWADTGTGNVKRRNAANSAWEIVGKIFPAGVVSAGAGSQSLPSISNDADLDTGIFFPAANTVAVATGGSERARIDSSGRLLVGTTTNPIATGNLQVVVGSGNSAVFLNNEASGGRPVVCWNQASSSQRQIAFLTGGSGTVAGEIVSSSTTTAYNTSSDYRLKENIQPMTGALERVLRYRPVTYTWKADGSVGRGYIAHWLQEDGGDGAVTGEKDAMRTEQYEISPGIPAVIGDDGEVIKPAVEAVMGEREVPQYQGIDTSFLVADLNGAIKEMHEIIVQLRAEVDALKGATT